MKVYLWEQVEILDLINKLITNYRLQVQIGIVLKILQILYPNQVKSTKRFVIQKLLTAWVVF